MINRAMERMLREGEAIDLDPISTIVEGSQDRPIVFRLNPEVQDIVSKDYCHGHSEMWVWSIGRRRSDGVIFAATDGRYYLNDKYECLWLR